jgi:hypothetical protein
MEHDNGELASLWRTCCAHSSDRRTPYLGNPFWVETMPEKSTVRLNLSDSDEDSEIEANAPSVDRNVSDGDPQVVPHDTEQDIVDTKKSSFHLDDVDDEQDKEHGQEDMS